RGDHGPHAGWPRLALLLRRRVFAARPPVRADRRRRAEDRHRRRSPAALLLPLRRGDRALWRRRDEPGACRRRRDGARARRLHADLAPHGARLTMLEKLGIMPVAASTSAGRVDALYF